MVNKLKNLENDVMTQKNDWNPELYLKFNKERTQPAIDLVSRISLNKPERIVDIGCGPGNSTQILAEKWPESQIIGVDSSSNMIEKARNDFPKQEWEILNIANTQLLGNFDIIFSNAAIQWVPNHSDLLKSFHNSLSKKGILAVQIPMFWNMPLGRSIANIAKDGQWSSVTEEVSKLFTIHDYSYYFDKLSELYSSVEIWKSEYIHELESQLSILEMIRSTGLKPYLEKLEHTEDKKEFENLVLKEIKNDYPQQKNGKVLLPFKRLFFIATK